MFSKRTLLGPVLLLVTVAISYPAYWLYAASLSGSFLQNWIEEQRSNGFTVNHRPVERSGFPLMIRLTLPALEASNAEMGFSWRSEKLQLELQPWDLRRLRLDALGPQQVQFKPSQDLATFTANITGFVGVAVIGNSSTLTALSIVLKEVRLTESEQGQLMQSGRILADIRRPEKPPNAHTEPVFEISLAAEHINTATVKAPILGDTIPNIRVKAEFLGPLDGDTLIEAVSRWRQSGGTVEVHWLNLIWGALDLRANGTIALDQELRPLGALTADIRGYEEALEALAEARLIRRDILPASRVTLNLLAKTSETDGRRVLTVPVNAQGGGLYLGPIKLAELPVLLNPPSHPSVRQD